MKRGASFALLVFCLNVIWEMAQMRWFASMENVSFWRATFVCARATLGDLIITAVAFGLATVVGKSGRWPHQRPIAMPAITFVLAGLAITAAYEVFAVGNGKWQYGEAMPTLFGIGALPLLQWLLLPVTEIVLLRFVAPRRPIPSTH